MRKHAFIIAAAFIAVLVWFASAQVPAPLTAITGVISGATTGQVAFYNGPTAITGDSAHFWDNTNKRLGIGTAAPATPLHVVSGNGGLRFATANDRGVILGRTTADAASWFVSDDNTQLQFGTAENQPLSLYTNNTLAATIDTSQRVKPLLFGSLSNCSSSAAPAVCSAAPAGSVVIAAAATTVTVNTTAVTANSQIFVVRDDSLGTKLSVTCNTATAMTEKRISARTGGTSFQITVAPAPATNPLCVSYFIVN